MKIGVPIEIKNNENRVGMTPSGVFELTKRNHSVFVQKDAGFHSGFVDDDYIKAGATILDTIEDVYGTAEMIVKVKEPIEPEYKLIRPDQIVFTYFHFASSEVLTNAMIVETIFSWPGLGNLLAEAIGTRDFALVQAIAFFTSLVVISLNLLTDIAYGLADPRIRYGE